MKMCFTVKQEKKHNQSLQTCRTQHFETAAQQPVIHFQPKLQS